MQIQFEININIIQAYENGWEISILLNYKLLKLPRKMYNVTYGILEHIVRVVINIINSFTRSTFK